MWNVLESFSNAVDALVTSGLPLRERLGDAYTYNLYSVQPSELPTDLEAEFRQMKDALVRVEPTGDEGRLVATIRSMSEDEVTMWLRTVVSLYQRIAQHVALAQ